MALDLARWQLRSSVLLLVLAVSACGQSPRGETPDAGVDAVDAPDDGPGSCVAANNVAFAAPIGSRFARSPSSPGRGLGALLPSAQVSSGPQVSLAPARVAHVAAPSTPARTDLRLLVLTATGSEPAFQAAAGALERLGVPFTTLTTATTSIDATSLWTETGDCRFAGIILAHSELSYQDGGGTWVSSLEPAEWQLLDNYEVACAAREVAWYSLPSPNVGLELVADFQIDATIDLGLTGAGVTRFPYLRSDASIGVTGVWGYRARILDETATTPLLQTATGEALAVIHRHADGREVLAMTFDASPWTRHSLLLEYGVIDWVSRGLFLGSRRIYLTPQIDDVFLETEMWGQVDVNYRIAASDVEQVVSWQQATQARLPAGSTFVTQMAFNGAGTDADDFPDTAMVDALRAHQSEFVWVNHTWDHTNMNSMSKERASAEVTENCELAAEWGMTGFACSELVTPQISGLDHGPNLDGLLEAGIKLVVSDTSITAALNPDNPGTNPSFNVGRPNPFRPAIYQVPRHPTNVYYNCSIPSEQVSLFNYFYAAPFGRELAYDEIIAMDAEVGVHYMLSYDVDPLMFHQANLRTFTGPDQTPRSLYADWIDAVLDRYLAQVTLPVLTLGISETARVMQERAAYDACGVRAQRIVDANGTRLELTSTGTCIVPITGVDAPAAGRVEIYGGVPTTYVPLDRCNPVSIPLGGSL